MHIENIYHNYDKHPYREIRGFDNEAWEGSKAIVKEIERHIQDLLKKQDKVIVNFDFYPGVRKEEIFEMIHMLHPKTLTDMDLLAKPEEVIEKEFNDYMTDDRVFGIICHKKLKDFFCS